MTKNDLTAMGLTEEQAGKVFEAISGDFVTKARFNEVNEENKRLKAESAEHTKQLDELKNSTGDNAELQKQIAELQQANKALSEIHGNEIRQLKLDNAVETALAASGARNSKAVRSLFDSGKLKLGEDGKVAGLDEQLAAIRKSDPYLFEEKRQETHTFIGFQPGASSDSVPNAALDPSKMTYSEMTAYLAANPDAKIE